jgi:hypothetical protein
VKKQTTTARTAAAAFQALAVLSLSCISSEVRLTTRPQPPRSDGCEVAVYSKGRPPFPVEDLAEDRAGCVFSRNHCVQRLRDDACLVGADTVYDLREVRQHMETTIYAILARRSGPATPAARAPDAPVPAFTR